MSTLEELNAEKTVLEDQVGMIKDGCSGGMSTLWRKIHKIPPPWEPCCNVHDRWYKEGGTQQLRRKADYLLLACVARRGHPVMAILMWWAVRWFGIPPWYKWKDRIRAQVKRLKND